MVEIKEQFPIFSLKRTKDLMCIKIRTSIKWEKNYYKGVFFVFIYKSEKWPIIIDLR